MLKKILIGIFYAYWIFVLFIFLNPFLQNQRAKRAFSKEKERLLINWDKHEEEIRSIKNMVVEFEAIKTMLPSRTDTLRIEIANCIEKSQEDFFEYLIANVSNIEELSESLYLAEHSKFEKEQGCNFTVSTNKVAESINNRFNIKIDPLLKTLEEANCQGFWVDENNDINVQFSGRNFFGSFNYLFRKEGSINDTLDINKKLEENVYWAFYESGLWCSEPIFIEN